MTSSPPADADRLGANLASVRDRIAAAAALAGRSPGDVTLVAVTKRARIDRVRTLVDLGAADLGENYPQELWAKAAAVDAPAVRWHLIGHLQANKAKKTLPFVRMIHGVDSLKLLLAIDELASAIGLDDPPAICLQVNVSGETSKHGWTPEAILADADAIAGARRVAPMGLMTIAPAAATGDTARPYFAALRDLRDRVASATGRAMPYLSMGMSGDYEAAIAEGATHVRVGSALFEGLDP